ncbi:MAG: hypothetical protein KF738_08345 [Burkholderiales bacterium]|nr:hypothetical protein [Burkholderiales bacterium]
MRAEYDFTGAVRGKYHDRLGEEGSNVVVLDPDVAKVFPDSTAVNEALRVVIKASRAVRRPARASRAPSAKPAAGSKSRSS